MMEGTSLSGGGNSSRALNNLVDDPRNLKRQASVVTWTKLILGHADKGQGHEAFRHFFRMVKEKCVPNAVTCIALLKACTGLAEQEEAREVEGKLVKVESLERGKAVHAFLVDLGVGRETKVKGALLVMYARCGCMVYARRVFEEMHHPNVVTWAALTLGYAENGQGQLAFDLYHGMLRRGCRPDSFVLVAALKACNQMAENENATQLCGQRVKVESWERGMALHKDAVQAGCELHLHVMNAVVNMYATCGRMRDAQKAFHGMQERDVVTWTSLIMGYAENAEGLRALDLFNRMQCRPNSITFVAALKACGRAAEEEQGKQISGQVVKLRMLEAAMGLHSKAVDHGCHADLYVASTLVGTYAKCGSLDCAHKVFEGMAHRNVVAWSALILGYAENGEGKVAADLLRSMQREGCEASNVTLLAALKAYGLLGALESGKAIHAEICKRGMEGSFATQLIDFYGRCWSMRDAQTVFDSLPVKSLSAWNTLLAGYGRHGDTRKLFDLFEEMQEIHQMQPDGITILCLLAACNHAGMVDQGKEYFELMSSRYKLEPTIEHYNCMIDMLGRASRLEDAAGLLKSMPLMPNTVTYRVLLSVCRKWGNIKDGTSAFESLVHLDNEDSMAYVFMSDIYEKIIPFVDPPRTSS